MTENKTHAGLTHLDERGRAKMVAVSAKPESLREAVAAAVVQMSSDAFEAVVSASGHKGDALQVCRVAAIMAAKKTAELIPLCHPVRLTSVETDARVDASSSTIELVVTVVAHDRTGVEMEAMTAASVAALTLYDMIKGMDRGAHIQSVRLLKKTGGKSGVFMREGSI